MTDTNKTTMGSGSSLGSYRSWGKQTWLVIVLMIMAMMAAVDRAILTLLIDPIKADLHLTDTQMSLVIGAGFAVANVLFTLPAGYVADRWSRRWLITIGGTVWSVMTMACGMAGGFVQLMAARAGVGFGESTIHPGALSMLRSAIPPERRGRAFGVYYMSSMMGQAFALLLGGLLIGAIESHNFTRLPFIGELSPWQMTLVLVGAVGLPLTALMLTVPEPTRPVANGLVQTGVSYRDALGHIWRLRNLYVPMWVAATIKGLISAGYGGWIAVMMQRQYGLSPAQVGVTLGIGVLIMPQIGSYLAGMIVDWRASRFGLRGVSDVALVMAVAFGAFAALVPQAPNLPIFITLIYFSMLVSTSSMPAFATMVSAITPPMLMGKVISVQLVITGLLATVAGPTSVALISDNFFEGPRAISNAITTVAVLLGWVPIVALIYFGRVAERSPELNDMVTRRVKRI